jgi:hypothetical protein
MIRLKYRMKGMVIGVEMLEAARTSGLLRRRAWAVAAAASIWKPQIGRMPKKTPRAMQAAKERG